MSKKFSKDLIGELQKLRYRLDDIANSGDLEEAIAECQELSADVDSIEELVCKKFKIYEYGQ